MSYIEVTPPEMDVGAKICAPEDGLDHLLSAPSNNDRRTLAMPSDAIALQLRRWRGAAAGLVVFMLLAAAIMVTTRDVATTATYAGKGSSPAETLNLNDMHDAKHIAGDVVDGLSRSAKMVFGFELWLHTTEKYLRWLHRLSKDSAALAKKKLAVQNRTTLSARELEQLVDEASMNLSHGFCAVDEEIHADLCYKKCRLLTNNQYPIRTTAFSCCESTPCGLFNQRLNVRVCSGYAVSGDAHGGGCPHSRGSCLDNEELHMGLCYKKCHILTGSSFPFRRGAATCCAVDSIVGCMNPANRHMSKKFIIGGGHDDDNPKTPSFPHLPLKAKKLSANAVSENLRAELPSSVYVRK